MEKEMGNDMIRCVYKRNKEVHTIIGLYIGFIKTVV